LGTPKGTSQIHSRRDTWIMSTWKRSLKCQMQQIVSFDKLISNTCAFLLLWCISYIHTKEIQGAMDKLKIHLIW
jgi:hypothetical protein